MLKKIIAVRNVGRFINSAYSGVPACGTHTRRGRSRMSSNRSTSTVGIITTARNRETAAPI
jgi:hypothetical protein